MHNQEIQCSTAEQAVEELLRIRQHILPQVIFVDGLCGVGKTYFSKELARKLCAHHIEIDNYFLESLTHHEPHILSKDRQNYIDYVNKPKVLGDIDACLTKGQRVIIDGACINELFTMGMWENELRIFFSNKRIAPEEDWTFPPDTFLDYRINPHRSVLLYHKHYQPQKKADLIIINQPH